MITVKNLLSSVALIAISSLASAGRYDANHIYAQVVDVQAIYTTYQVPQNRRVCKDEYRNYNNKASHGGNGGGAVLGAIVGGLIGNRFGKGHGRDAATAVGVIAGAAIGSNAKSHDYNRPPKRHCYTKTDYYEEQRVSGYDVSYDYNGRIYHTRLKNHPGDRVKIEVSVQAVEY
ncbi:MAG: glycine zipper 2TM domain-containing protein [Alcanivoracaceae bacterium]|nr:glycine zipper 2TM domain-containing protein [Alcanivoracaceae bacterium]